MYHDGKECAILSFVLRSFSEGVPCTVILRSAQDFLAKVPAPSNRGARILRRVTQPPFIAGPIIKTFLTTFIFLPICLNITRFDPKPFASSKSHTFLSTRLRIKLRPSSSKLTFGQRRRRTRRPGLIGCAKLVNPVPRCLHRFLSPELTPG